MRVPKLNVRLSLDYDVVSRADSYCLNPVVQVVNRNHEGISANPAVCVGITMGARVKFCRSIERKCIIEEINREIVKVITRLPAACALAVGKIWHRGGYRSLKLPNLIAIRTELRDRVDRRLGISLAYLGCIVSAVTVSERNQVLLTPRVVTPFVIYSQTNR